MMNLTIEETIESNDINELEGMIKEMKGEGFNIFKRSLPFGLNQVVALNIPSFKDAMILVKAMKLKTKEETRNGETTVTFYDVLPNTVKLDDLLYNDQQITTVGNKRKDVASAYFDIGE